MITAILGQAISGVPDEVMPYMAFNKRTNPDLGTRPGQWLYCKAYLAQVMAREGTCVQLCGLGWVDLSTCRLIE